jgi:hypothetical protein
VEFALALARYLLRSVLEPMAVHLAGAVKSIVERPTALSVRLEASRREIVPAAIARRCVDLARHIGLLAASGHPAPRQRAALRYV